MIGVTVWIKSPPKKQYIVRKVGQNFEGAVVEIKGRKELSQGERAREKTIVTWNPGRTYLNQRLVHVVGCI